MSNMEQKNNAEPQRGSIPLRTSEESDKFENKCHSPTGMNVKKRVVCGFCNVATLNTVSVLQ
jgi:hypothetical protein